MKKLFALLMIVSMLLTCACSEETVPTVETFDPNTIAPTSETEETTEPTSEEPTEDTTQDIAPTPIDCAVQYSSVTTHRDSVGNVWVDAIVEIKNNSQKAICLMPDTLAIYADGELVCTMEGVECYPRVIEPGQVGYYFDQKQQYVDENATLTAEINPSLENAYNVAQYIVEDSQLTDAAFGISVQGMFPLKDDLDAPIRVAAILFDAEQKPLAVLFEDIDGGANDFVLESDKLPETLSRDSIASHIVYVYEYAPYNAQ